MKDELTTNADAGCAYTIGNHEDFKQTHLSKEEYISNLKLDI